MMLSKVVRQPGVCWGTWNGQSCPVSARRHRSGMLDGFGAIHFADRRFSRRAARNLLLLVARRERERDPKYLNDPLYDWLYVYVDAVEAQRLAMRAGVRLPARLFDRDREVAKSLAARRNVPIWRYPRFRSWLGRASC